MDKVLTRKLFKDRYLQTISKRISNFKEGGLASLRAKHFFLGGESSFTPGERQAAILAPIASALLTGTRRPGQSQLGAVASNIGAGLPGAVNTAIELAKVEKEGKAGVTVNTGEKETAEQKKIGEGLGKQFVDIMERSDLAANDQGNLNIISELTDKADLTTGFLGPISTTAQRAAEAIGFNPGFQNTPAAELLQSIGGKVAIADLQKFKGAMSDKELTFVTDINPGLSMTKEGIKALVSLKKRGNDLAIKYAEDAQVWAQENGGISKKNKEGKTWSQFTREFHEANPLVNPSQREALKQLSARTPDAGFKTPVVNIGNTSYDYIGGKYYPKTGGK